MRLLKYILPILLIYLLFGCKEEPVYIANKISINNIKNNTTYTNPLLLSFNDQANAEGVEIMINGEIINLEEDYPINRAGYYQLIVNNKNFNETDTICFVILNPERGSAEWGLKTWTPKPFSVNTITNQQVQLIYPKNILSGVHVPVIVKVINNDKLVSDYFKLQNSVNSDIKYIKQGVGSVNLETEDPQTLFLTIGTKEIDLSNITVANKSTTIPTVISEKYVIPENSVVKISTNITIEEGASLIIEQGAIIAIDVGVNIENNGGLYINGKENNPVYFCCSDLNNYWGGFIIKGTDSVTIENTIFTQSGYHNSAEYQWGHAKRQALFYIENSSVSCTNSYMIDHIGQVFYSLNASINITNCVIQRVKTGGQVNNTKLNILNSVFTDFPNDDSLYRDEDNDALYINASDAIITKSLFMYAKDDGLDSGGGAGGTITIDSCHFEANFHEGIAMSSQNEVSKTHTISNSTFKNCGQGIELGYSSINHTVNISNCLITENNIGIRYGDNYDWSYEGYMNINDTRIVNNYDKDIWNMVHTIWKGKYDKMSFKNTTVTIADAHYPELIIEK